MMERIALQKRTLLALPRHCWMAAAPALVLYASC